jgi:DNA-binding NarL/FixJ family response regulator
MTRSGDTHDDSDASAGLRSLPPRLQRVLDLLLTGLSEKEIPEYAGLTRATTHQYVVEIYRRVGVRSRPQLMALALRRRSPS